MDGRNIHLDAGRAPGKRTLCGQPMAVGGELEVVNTSEVACPRDKF